MLQHGALMNQPSRFFGPYMVLVGMVGYGLLAWLIARLIASQQPVMFGQLAFFLVLSVLVGLHPIPLPTGAEGTMGFAVDYAVLLIFGPTQAACIGVLSFLVLLRRSHWHRQLFNHGQIILAFAVAGWLYQLLGGSYIVWSSAPVEYGKLQAWAAMLAAAGGYLLTSSLLVAVGMGLCRRRPILGMWAFDFRWTIPHYLALAPFGLLMAIVYQLRGLGPAAVTLFLVPLAGARYAFQGAMEMLQVHRETVQALSAALEAYDPYTRNHSELVTRYALALGQELSLSAQQLETLEWAARIHDIGKCRQDWEPIIRKPGRPTDAEWEIIKQHPVEGAKLAAKMEFMPNTAGQVARVVRAHHERYDGKGYPDGLTGEAIPIEASILCVADAFEAMTSRRAYQRSRPVEEAVVEIGRCAGTQFDPRVADALAALHARGALEIATETQPEEGILQGAFVPEQA